MGGGLVSDRDLSAHPPLSTHPLVWMVEHSPESNAGQAGISVQISRDSPISLTQESGRAGPAEWELLVFHSLHYKHATAANMVEWNDC